MKKIFLMMAVGVLSIYFVSCKKEKKEDTPKTPESRQSILSKENWVISTVEIGGQDIWSSFIVQACYKDNEYNFKTNDTLEIYDKVIKCDAADPNTLYNNYKLLDAENKMYLNLELTPIIKINDTATLIELTNSKLKMIANYSGSPATVTFIKK